MLARLRRRLRLLEEQGFGLIELMVSLVLLSIVIAALIGIFMAGAFSIARSGHKGTATVVVDRIFEYYRRAPWYDIRLVKGGTGGYTAASSDSKYTSQCLGCPGGASGVVVDEDVTTLDEYGSDSNPANGGSKAINNTSTCNTGLSGSTDPDVDATAPITSCKAIADITGADNDPYRVYTYMKYACVRGSSPCTPDYQTKVVTLIVRQLDNNGALVNSSATGILAEQTETFSFSAYTTEVTAVAGAGGATTSP